MNTTLLTVGIIQDFHKEVLRSNRHAGKLRDCHVCINFNFETHIYPPPYLIETQLASICDVANRRILTCKLLNDFIETEAWTAYNTLSLHPFHDGNGRVVRAAVAFLLLDMQIPTIIKNWNEPLVTIRHSIPYDVSPLSEWIQEKK